MAYDTPILSSVSTVQPAPPATNPPADWSSVVHANYFLNIERLGQWIGGTNPVDLKLGPAEYFNPVAANSLGSGTSPGTIYVLVHGWAPGFNTQVPANGDVFWWSSSAAITVEGKQVWPSSWAWEGMTIGTDLGSNSPFQVSSTGMLQSICGMDSNATTLCYSWLDDSATDSVALDNYYVNTYAYQSEANTHVNGMRIANALQEAIDSSFFTNGGQLHLIGHSHGSRVCTVAAMTLQQAYQIQVARLTLLDSPEIYPILEANAGNLLGSYLESLNIMDPANPKPDMTFVENYASLFGVMYDQSNQELSKVVGVCLYPEGTGSAPSISDGHDYAAGWYGASASSSPAVGLAWTTPPSSYTPALLQEFPNSSPTQSQQFTLDPGTVIETPVYNYATYNLSDTTMKLSGTSAYATMEFSGLNSTPVSEWVVDLDQFGIAFDVTWASPQVGDYLVASVSGNDSTVLVIDGQSAPTIKGQLIPVWMTTVFINVTEMTLIEDATLSVYFVAAPNSPNDDQVTVSNFQWVAIPEAGTDIVDP